MAKIYMEVNGCSSCPLSECKRIYTADSFEILYKYTCKVNPEVHQFSDDHVKDVPENCPRKIN